MIREGRIKRLLLLVPFVVDFPKQVKEPQEHQTPNQGDDSPNDHHDYGCSTREA